MPADLLIFLCGRIFISCFSEPLDINSEVLNCLLLGKGLFIQIYFGRLCLASLKLEISAVLGNSKETKSHISGHNCYCGAVSPTLRSDVCC